MKQVIIFLVGLQLLAGVAAAQPVTQSREEIAHLLAFVERSGCRFNRNGTWHEARDASLHLQKKFEYLDQRGLVPDSESFIGRAASQSSLSGRQYEVRCAGAKAIPSAHWLTEELHRFRNGQGK